MDKLEEKLENGIKLYCESFGKLYRVRAIRTSVRDANDFCEENKDCAVISSDEDCNVIIIAEIAECKSPVLV